MKLDYWSQSARRFLSLHIDWLVAIFYIFAPYVFFGLGVDLIHVPLAPENGMTEGLPTRMFAITLDTWNPYVQSGAFPVKDMIPQALYFPALIIMRLFPNPFGYNIVFLAHYSLAGAFTFLFLRRLKLNRTASLVGGIVFMFSAFLTAHKNHLYMMTTAAYLPVELYFIESFIVKRKVRWLLAAAGVFAMSILSAHPAVLMYNGMLLIPYIGARILWGGDLRGVKFWKKLVLIVLCVGVMVGIGSLLAAAQILPVADALP